MLIARRWFLLLQSLVLSVWALDVEVTDYECDQSLYITADFDVLCSGSKRCTFGESIAHVTGTLYYNKVYNTGLEDNVGYLSTDVELLTLKYNFHDMMPVPLCSAYLTAGENNAGECPADGSYDFAVSYELPGAGDPRTSWLASGWAGSGVLRIYAENDETMLIGECSFNLKTFVTPDSTRGIMQTPSAAASVGILLGSLAAMSLVCMWCYCCAKKRSNNKITNRPDDSKSITKDDLSTFFKRLEEDNKSRTPTNYPGTITAASSSVYATSVVPPPARVEAPSKTANSSQSMVSALNSQVTEDKKKGWLPFMHRNKESNGTGGTLIPFFSRKKKLQETQQDLGMPAGQILYP